MANAQDSVVDAENAKLVQQYKGHRVDVSNALREKRVQLDSLPRSIYSANDLTTLANTADRALIETDPLAQIGGLAQLEQIMRRGYITEFAIRRSGGKLPPDDESLQMALLLAEKFFNKTAGYKSQER